MTPYGGYGPPPQQPNYPQGPPGPGYGAPGYPYPGTGLPYGVDPSRVDASGHHPGTHLWVTLSGVALTIGYLGGMGLIVGGAVAQDPDVTPFLIIVGYLMILVGALFFYVKVGLAMYWLLGAWKWLPMDWRYDKVGKPFGPDKVWLLLIPYFHLYWMFPVNLALCDAMDRLRQTRYPQGQTMAPRNLALWCCICELIPFANFFVAPFLWGSYMKQIDAMHEEMQAFGA